MIKYFAALLFLAPLYNCQPEKTSAAKVDVIETKPKTEISQSQSIVINKIDQAKIGKQLKDQKQISKLKNVFKVALQRQMERPQMWDLFVADNDTLMQFFPYQNFNIGDSSFHSFVIKVPYEDASYESILLTNNVDNDFNSLLVYENLEAEVNYQRFSQVSGDLITVDMRSEKTLKEKFQVNKGMFLDYLDAEKVDQQWGQKEKTNSGTISEYLAKGQTLNHLKDKYWIEKRYLIEYGKSVITDGNYINGLKDGEWNYSPDGPVDKTVIYKNGKVVSEKSR